VHNYYNELYNYGKCIFYVGDDEGEVGSVSGGGRYDNLVNMFNPSKGKVTIFIV